MFATGWKLSILFSLALAAPLSFSESMTIFEVRNTLALSDNETLYRDYYINAGEESGLKPGVVVTVKRKIALYDSYRNKSPGDMRVSVAKVKIIFVQNGLAVARDHSTISTATNPLLTDDFVMVGDELDISTATREKASAEVPSSPSESLENAEPIEKPEPVASPKGSDFAVDFSA